MRIQTSLSAEEVEHFEVAVELTAWFEVQRTFIGPRYLNLVLKAHRLSIRQLAKEIGISKSHLTRIVNNEQAPSLELCQKLVAFKKRNQNDPTL